MRWFSGSRPGSRPSMVGLMSEGQQTFPYGVWNSIIERLFHKYHPTPTHISILLRRNGEFRGEAPLLLLRPVALFLECYLWLAKAIRKILSSCTQRVWTPHLRSSSTPSPPFCFNISPPLSIKTISTQGLNPPHSIISSTSWKVSYGKERKAVHLFGSH
jgi:hypothetical protein